MGGGALDIKLWTMRKGARRFSATIRATEQVGIELRFLMNRELYMSRLFKPSQGAELIAASQAKRRDLEAKGWTE
jgi:hypothetical protein